MGNPGAIFDLRQRCVYVLQQFDFFLHGLIFTNIEQDSRTFAMLRDY